MFSFRKCLDKGVVRTLLDGELPKTSEFGRTLDKHLLKLAPLVRTPVTPAVAEPLEVGTICSMHMMCNAKHTLNTYIWITY